MQTMKEVISDPSRRAAVVKDVCELVDREVASKGGLTGAMLKAGYMAVKKLRDGTMISEVVNGLLPEFADAIEPVHAPYRERPAGGFAQWLQNHRADSVNALLSVTDARARTTKHALIGKTYGKLRPTAEKHVGDALPGLGALVDRHCRDAS
jgi:hypothetical protein